MSRPVLPAGPHHHDALPGSSSAASPGEPAGGSGDAGGGGGAGRGGRGPAKPQYSKRGKITIVACVPCRKRKTKCDGKRPACGQCTARESACLYDMTDDQRKLTYLRDNVEQLQEKSNTLESLLHTIQTAGPDEAAEIFRRLRAGVDVNAVAEQVQAGRLLSGAAGRASSEAQASSISDTDSSRLRQYDDLMRTISSSSPQESNDLVRRIRNGEDVAAIMEAVNTGNLSPQRLIRRISDKTPAGLENDFSRSEVTFGMVKGAPMASTHATLNTAAEFTESRISRPWTNVTRNAQLVEYLFAMYFTWQHSFFQSFPEKLFRADMEAGRTKYCSSMLVNAICAAGCFLCDRDKLNSMDSNGDTLADRFYNTALAELESTRTSSITTTAALYLISYVEGTRGRLSNLWMFSGRSALMAIDINLHLQRAFKMPEDPAQRQEAENERKARCHAFWGAFHVDQMTAFTLGRLPNLNSHGVTQELPPISSDEDEEPWSSPEFGTLPQRPGARGSTFAYCATLSQIINSTLLMFFAPIVPLSGSLLVDQYDRYLDWHSSLPPILASTENAPPHVICLHMYYYVAILHLFRPFLKATIDNSTVVPRDVCRHAANSISELWTQHRTMYHLRGIYMFQVHCLLAACTIHVINIPSISATRHFTEACKAFQELIPKNEWARSSLKVLRSLVEKWGLILPLEAEEALCRDAYQEEEEEPRGPITEALLFSTHQQATDPSRVFSNESTDRGPIPHSQAMHLTREKTHPSPGTQAIRQLPTRGPRGQDPSFGSAIGKRPSAGEIPAATELASGTQKKQRLMAPDAPGAASSTAAVTSESGVARPSAANFLYSPLAGQPAPMLVPVATSGGQSASRNRTRPSSGDPGTPASSSSAPSSVAPAGGPRPAGSSSRASSSAAAQRAQQGKRDGMGDVQEGVEGLSFGDDWRDPFMGFLEE